MSDAHDPLERQIDGEPRFVLLGRDPTACDLVKLWTAIRRRDAGMIDAIVVRLKATMLELPYQPHKDLEHIQSAHRVANEMFCWLAERKVNPIILEPVDDPAPETP